MPATEDDGQLMARLQAGDDRALDELMDRWQVGLRRFLHRWTDNGQDALDLAQETFVRVYLHRAKFRPGSKFSTWLFAIAVNLSRDHYRRARTRKVVLMEDAALAAAVEAPGREAQEDAPSAALVGTEAASAVRAAVHALPEPLKATVLLSVYEDLAHAEVADILGCTQKAVETRLHRARGLLRGKLAGFV